MCVAVAVYVCVSESNCLCRRGCLVLEARSHSPYRCAQPCADWLLWMHEGVCEEGMSTPYIASTDARHAWLVERPSLLLRRGSGSGASRVAKHRPDVKGHEERAVALVHGQYCTRKGTVFRQYQRLLCTVCTAARMYKGMSGRRFSCCPSAAHNPRWRVVANSQRRTCHVVSRHQSTSLLNCKNDTE